MNYNEHTGASKVITQVRSSCRRLACLGVDEYAWKKCEEFAERIAGNRSLSEGAD